MKNTFGLAILVLLLTGGCKTTFTAGDCTRQVWRGGAAGSGGGCNYKIPFTVKGKVRAGINEIWVGMQGKGQNPDFQIADASGKGIAGDQQGMFFLEPGTYTLNFAEYYPFQGNPRDPGQQGPKGPQVVDLPEGAPEGFESGVLIFWSAEAGDRDAKPAECLAIPMEKIRELARQNMP